MLGFRFETDRKKVSRKSTKAGSTKYTIIQKMLEQIWNKSTSCLESALRTVSNSRGLQLFYFQLFWNCCQLRIFFWSVEVGEMKSLVCGEKRQ